MLDAGTGIGAEEEVKDAVIAAARLFEQAGAEIIPVGPVLTRAMLDGWTSSGVPASGATSRP